MILNMNTKSFLFLLILVLGTFSCTNRNTAEMLKDIESYIQGNYSGTLAIGSNL